MQKPKVTTLARHEHGNLSHKRRRRGTDGDEVTQRRLAHNLSVESNQNVKSKQKHVQSPESRNKRNVVSKMLTHLCLEWPAHTVTRDIAQTQTIELS